MKLLWVLASALALCAGAEQLREFVPDASFENVKFSQTYDMTGTYIKQSIALTVKNTGSEPQSEYYYAVDKDTQPHISVLEARIVEDEDNKGTGPLPVDLEGVDSKEGAYLYKVEFPEPLEVGKTLELQVAQAVTDQLSPLPESGTQDDQQFLFYRGSRYPYSAYTTRKAETSFKTVGSQAQEIDADETDKPQVADNTISYGSYSKLGRYVSKSIKLRYENPKAMIKAAKLSRDVWVSHWGSSVSFEETYWLHNFGTKLKESFSRLKYQRGQNTFNLNIAALKTLAIPLKPNARDAYYVDLVGNVSTSKFRSDDKATLFTINPRYPIFGGWNYNFTIGWSTGIENYVKDVGEDQYLLKVPFVEGPNDIYYDEVDFTVVLPEGATEINVLSLSGREVEYDVIYSFLDTVGRPIVRLKYDNIIDGHRRGEVYVKYKYTLSDALRKPLMICATLMAFFGIVIVLGNIDINIVRRGNNNKK